MSKPAFVIWVGVRSLENNDVEKLPKKVQEVYKTGYSHECYEIETIFDGLELTYVHNGKPDSADPGETIGFGVQVFHSFWDSDVMKFDPKKLLEVCNTAEEKLTALFKKWGLEAVPRVYEASVWCS
jgi:hypothetical protein